MNQEQAGEILRANVKNLSEPLKSAVEFALTNFFTPSAADLAKKFLSSVPYEVFMARDLRETNLELKSKIDAAYFTLMNDEKTWLSIENLPHEEWRDVLGYERLYKVSNLGRVTSFKRGKTKILHGNISDKGYYNVDLFKGNSRKRYGVHVLVAQAFIPNPSNKPEGNHLFGKKNDNRVTEIDWSTHSENIQHAFDIGLNKKFIGEKSHRAKLSNSEAAEIRRNCIPRDKNLGIRAFARKFNLNWHTVADIVYGRTYKDAT